MNIVSWGIKKDIKNEDDKKKYDQIENLVSKRIGGGSIIEHQPLFSSDSETLYIIWNHSIRAYGVQTGECYTEFESANDPLIGILLSPENANIIIGCTEKPELIFWDCQNGLITMRTGLVFPGDTKNFMLKSFHMVQYTNSSGIKVHETLLTYTTLINKLLNVFIVLYDYKVGTKTLYKQIVFEKENYYVDIIGNYGENLIGIASEKYLYVMSPAYNLKFLRHKTERTFTCVCGHPEDECLATGDESGRIQIWKNISEYEPVKGTYHWHSLPVSVIAFSRSGEYMYSGGRENVLVKWVISNPQNRAYLPRLPSPIKYLALAPENLYVSISTIDNGITIINAHRQIISTIQNFTWCDERISTHFFPAGLVLDPLTNSIVLNSRVGHIQFFKPSTRRLMYNINITDENIVSEQRDVKIVNTDVIRIAFAQDGSWMLTHEERAHNISYKEIRFKFWKYETEKQTYSLKTVINYPHNDGINAIKFRPRLCDDDPYYAISLGQDGVFKIWVYWNNLIKNTASKYWQLCIWQRYRDLIPNDADFVIDGSLLAIGFNNNLTMWTSESLGFKCNLSHAQLKGNIKKIEFGKLDLCHLIAVNYVDNLAVWDIDDLSVKWIVKADVILLTSDGFSPYMSAFTADRTLIIFTPDNANPVYQRTNIIKDDEDILGSCFVPHEITKNGYMDWQSVTQLYYLTSNKELMALEPKNEIDNIFQISITSDIPETRYSRMLCPKIRDAENCTPIVHRHQDSDSHQAYIDLILTTPAYKLPPMRTLITPFLISLIKKHQPIVNHWKRPLNPKIELEKEDPRPNNCKIFTKQKKDESNSADEIDEAVQKIDFSFLKGILPSKGDLLDT